VIVLDASVLIALLDPRDAHHDTAVNILDGDDGPWVVHPLTMAETLVGPVQRGVGTEVLADLADAGITVNETATDPLQLAATRARHGLRMPDACVLWLAEALDTTLVTFDDKLADRARDAGRLYRPRA